MSPPRFCLSMAQSCFHSPALNKRGAMTPFRSSCRSTQFKSRIRDGENLCACLGRNVCTAATPALIHPVISGPGEVKGSHPLSCSCADYRFGEEPPSVGHWRYIFFCRIPQGTCCRGRHGAPPSPRRIVIRIGRSLRRPLLLRHGPEVHPDPVPDVRPSAHAIHEHVILRQ